MAKYKIKVIAHQLKNNVVAKYGEVVDETQLNGNAALLESQGFIEKVLEENLVEVVEDSFDLDKMSKAELVEFCKINEIEILDTDTKKQILDKIELDTKK